MIQLRTMLKVADNTGAKIVQTFHVAGGTDRRYARVGDVVMAAVKEAEPRKMVKKHDKVRVVIIRQKKNIGVLMVPMCDLTTMLVWY